MGVQPELPIASRVKEATGTAAIRQTGVGVESESGHLDDSRAAGDTMGLDTLGVGPLC